MVFNVGVDILDISRISTLAADDIFFKKTFTPRELQCSKETGKGYTYLAGRFAAKEAVFKAVGISPDKVRFIEIETLNDKNGAPYVTLYGFTAKEAAGRGVQKIHISLSYDGGMALAFAAACGTKKEEN